MTGLSLSLGLAPGARSSSGGPALTFDPAVFPEGHPAALDRVLAVRLYGAASADKFYSFSFLFYHDVDERMRIVLQEADDAVGTGIHDVSDFIENPANYTGVTTIPVPETGVSGITAEMDIDFGDGVTAFALYSGTYANAGLIAA